MNKIIRYIIIQILFIQNLCEILFNFQRNKTKYTSSKNDTEIFTYLSENFLFTNIKLGTPYQEIPLRISTEYNGLNILSKSAMDKLISFDQSNSSSYYNISEEIEGNLEFFNKIILSKETFNFNNTTIANLSFVLGVSNNKNYSGIIGLRKISNLKDNITNNINNNTNSINTRVITTPIITKPKHPNNIHNHNKLFFFSPFILSHLSN